MSARIEPQTAGTGRRGLVPANTLPPGLSWVVRAFVASLALVFTILWGELGAVVGVASLAGTELSLRLGPLPVTYAIALLAFPPGVLARNGLAFLVAAGIIVILPIFVKSDSERLRWVALLAAAPPIAATSLIAAGNRNFELLMIVACLSIPIYFLGSRRAFAMQTVSAMAWAVALLSASYLVSVATGAFINSAPTLLEFPNDYAWNVYFPCTPTVGGTQVLGQASNLPRFVVFTHEPGLSVFFLVVALSHFIGARGLCNRAGLVTVILGLLATQSLGTYISLAAGVAAAIGLWLWQHSRRLVALIVALIGVLAVYRFAESSVETRLSRSAVTLHDRGLGGGDTLAVGNVSLNVGLEHYTLEATLLILALLAAAACLSRNVSPAGIFLFVATVVTASFNEPLQWQFGVWVILGIHFIASQRPTSLGSMDDSAKQVGWKTKNTSPAFRAGG